MKEKCPFCRQKMQDEISLPHMSWRETQIYNAVVSSGKNNYVHSNDLVKLMYRPGRTPTPAAWGVLRVAINGINKKIKPLSQRIKGFREMGYRLVWDAPVSR